MKVPETKNIRVDEENGLVVLTMNRPEAMNALNNEMFEELQQLMNWIRSDREILGIILIGQGKAFVAGADIRQIENYKAAEGRNYAGLAQHVFNQLEELEKPTIAAVNGYALGGGCELSLCCDLRIASDQAVFGQPEVNLGLIPCFGGTQRLSRLIGTGKAKELIYTARRVYAQEAYAIGLVNKVVAAEALLEEAKKLMQTIISKSPAAVRYSKTAINHGIQMDLYRGLELEKDVAALAFASEDKEEGIKAFLEKRQPVFHKR
ncbi:MAG: enoyl-CoA hydratase/isomerase family protein [Hespellia sp.]|nr:enoyl-CoA hydratase/isomerase family protein [Hespellia sp.]